MNAGVKQPAPYPADTRAKGWRFELDYEQIEQSSTWAVAKPAARPWLLMMWMLAWKQVPCGSWPADEEVIAGALGIDDDQWALHRKALMRGWVEADDGRMYHQTLTKRVHEMMAKRRSDSDRQVAKRARVASESDRTHTGVTRDTDRTHTGVGSESSTDNRPPITLKEENPTGSSSAERTARPSIPCPYQAIVELYHAALPSLPKVRLMPKGRQTALRKAWGWVLSSTKTDGSRRATNADEALLWLGSYFARAADNDFLMGRTQRSTEHADWRCDLDFLLTDKGMKQVIEKTAEAA